MKGMTFENFRVDGGNRAAYDYCRRAAMLEYESGLPVVLLGPEGAGKSHLLWSVVKHVRASSGRVGLALVMAREFPDQVRQLAINPAPIQDDKPALLLVDELEAFEEDAYALEGVVKAFLANGHGVLLASSVHPDRLAAFTESFRALLCRGTILEMRPVGPLLDEEEEELALLESLRTERDALEQKLAQKANESAELNHVKARLDEAMRQVEILTLSLADTSRFDALHEQHKTELAAVQAEREGYRQALDAMRGERDAIERRLADRTAEAAEADLLRERLLALEGAQASASAEEQGEIARLRGEVSALEAARGADAARAAEEAIALRSQLAQAEESAARANATQASLRDRISHLQAEMAEYRGGLEEARDLRKQLEEMQAALLGARDEAGAAARAVQAVEAIIAAERAAAQQSLGQLRGELDALIAVARARGPVDTRELDQLREELLEARGMSAAFRSQMDQDRHAFEEEATQLRAENAELQALAQKAMAEQGRTLAAHETLKARARTLEYELEKERKQNALLTAEMEALRNEAATQVAQANISAGEMESRVVRLRDALDIALLRGKSASQHADALSVAFAQASAALAAAREDLAGIDLPAFDATAEDASETHAQPSLFDTSPFMRELAALPDSFEMPACNASAPNDARPLHELVEEALAGDGPLTQ